LHNGELHNLYSSPNNIRQIKSRRMTWEEHVARVGKWEKSAQGFGGKPEEKRPFERSRRRWEDGMGIDLREIGLEGVKWIHLAHEGSCEHGDERSSSGATELVT
jgi:hypothetical protein